MNLKLDYHPSEIEVKWQKIWEDANVYSPKLDTAKKPFYNLMMFPYPSAEGMHVGNMYAFTGADVYGRFMRMQGFDVFEPIGLDGFGIHSENYAIKIGRHPREQAKISEANFYRQLKATGNGFDWSRKLETYDPKYYKWTQWLFIQLFKAGLAYRAKAKVNWCPSCKTVLADEQVIQKLKTQSRQVGTKINPDKSGQKSKVEETIGVCERCETELYKKELEQWFFRITKYADRLLANLAQLDWSEKVKIAQRQWIGRSEGALIKFKIVLDSAKVSLEQYASSEVEKYIKVFTTRADTFYGATFLVLAPEHPLVAELLKSKVNPDKSGQKSKEDEISKYVEQAKKKTEQERITEGKEKTGVFTGLYAINPVNNEKIPIWIADYVLMGYGTGAIMGVPGHDQRDFEFAKKYKLPIRQVILRPSEARGEVLDSQAKPDRSNNNERKEVYVGGGAIANSGEWNGWRWPEEIGKVIDWLEQKGIGKREVTYHLRDWLISRQRYWGPPIPMIYCEKCKWQPVAQKDLPVLLPDVKDWKPKGTGRSPLATVESFVNTTCPNCKSPAKRETDVSDTFLDSAWYFFRYVSTDIDNTAFDIERVKKWLPVKMYIGGAEHSVLHLLYARFITLVLKDLDLIDFVEPFKRFYAHGLLIKEAAKMSKSKGNVVIPDEYIKKYGADTLRCYLMFLGPFNQGGDFYDTGIEGMYRFIKRVWKLICLVIATPSETRGKQSQVNRIATSPDSDRGPRNDMARERLIAMHKTIKKVTEDIEYLRYNTAIASLMEWYNYISKSKYQISKIEIETYLKLLAPFAPHITEELWQRIESGIKNQESRKDKSQNSLFMIHNSIHMQPWPTFDPKFLEEDEVTIVVQVDGKLRDILKSQKSIPDSIGDKSQKYIEELARKSDKIKKYVEGKEIKKVVYVEGKIINFVTE